MKKILMSFILTLCAILANAQVKVLGKIEPNGATDNYPTHVDSLGRGGFVAVKTWQERNNIPLPRRKAGMMVSVKSATVDSLYRLGVGLSNADWECYIIPKEINILAIGNSFTRDELGYMPIIFKKILPEVKLNLTIAYLASASLENHYNNLLSNASVYATDDFLAKNDAYISTTSRNLNDIINNRKFDVVVFNQLSRLSVNYSTYQPFLNDLVTEISNRLTYGVKFGLVLNHSYADGYPDLANILGMTSDQMLQATKSAQEKALEASGIDFIIPTGIAIQDARKNPTLDTLGDFGHLTYDGNHLQEGIPKLIAGYCASLSVLDMVGFKHNGFFGDKTSPDNAWTSTHNIPGINGNSAGVNSTNVILSQEYGLRGFKKKPTTSDNSLQRVTDRNNTTSNTLFLTGDTRPVGTPTGKAVLLEIKTDNEGSLAGMLGTYNYDENRFITTILGTSNPNPGQGGVVIGGRVTAEKFEVQGGNIKLDGKFKKGNLEFDLPVSSGTLALVSQINSKSLADITGVGNISPNTVYITDAVRPIATPTGKTIMMELRNNGVGGKVGLFGTYDYAAGSFIDTVLGSSNNLQGNVGIGTMTPTQKLEVAGKIKAASINFTGLPTYADDATAGIAGLTAGDCYKTSSGELRIKL